MDFFKAKLEENLNDLQIDLMKTNSIIARDFNKLLIEYFKSPEELNLENNLWLRGFLQKDNRVINGDTLMDFTEYNVIILI
jgi:hypothetical protein